MTYKYQNTIYTAPTVEVVELTIEGNILGMSVGVGGWKEDEEDFGGTAQ